MECLGLHSACKRKGGVEEELLEVSASQYMASLILWKALISLNFESEYAAVNVEEMNT